VIIGVATARILPAAAVMDFTRHARVAGGLSVAAAPTAVLVFTRGFVGPPIVIPGIRPLVATVAGLRPGPRDGIRPAPITIKGIRDVA
jgi:hypothetical protein